MKTKWDVLIEQRDAAITELMKAQHALDDLTNVSCGLNCSACGELLVTEADFARHFVVKEYDIKLGLLNLGYCPNVTKIKTQVDTTITVARGYMS